MTAAASAAASTPARRSAAASARPSRVASRRATSSDEREHDGEREQVGQRLRLLVLRPGTAQAAPPGQGSADERHHDRGRPRRASVTVRARWARTARADWAADSPCGGNPIVAAAALGRPLERMGSPTTADEVTGGRLVSGAPSDAPVVDRGRAGSHKSFRIPEQRIDSLRERATHPFTRVEYREHRALRDVSFDVHAGRVLRHRRPQRLGQEQPAEDPREHLQRRCRARPDRRAGVAPFIELGVGFNPELTARENGVLNGVLMGLTLREARRQLDAVLEFAELEDFVDLQLKNYSSGMLVRLAFAVMVQADADVMLIDEVLAVGDAAFAAEVHGRVPREAPRRQDDRAGHARHDDGADALPPGDAAPRRRAALHRRARGRGAALLPDELRTGDRPPAGRRRGQARRRQRAGDRAPRCATPPARRWRTLARGRADRARRRAGGGRDRSTRPIFSFHVRNDDGVRPCSSFDLAGSTQRRSPPGERVRLAGPVENPLVPGPLLARLYIREDARGWRS